MNKLTYFAAAALLALGSCCCPKNAEIGDTLPEWKPGYFDVHQISTGRGNVALMVLPDATTMMVDMGDLGDVSNKKQEIMPIMPNASKTPAQWAAKYISRVLDEVGRDRVDMALVTHFDADHVGAYYMKDGVLTKSGFAEIEDLIHIEKLVDRGHTYPDAEALRVRAGNLVAHHLEYLKYRESKGLKYEKFVVGSSEQFKLLRSPKKYPDFKIQNIYANGQLWSGKGLETIDLVPGEGEQKRENEKYMNENRNSCTINISYGDFDYHNGGDIQGMKPDSPNQWLNTEKQVAEFIKEVDVAVANHHSYSDAMFSPFLEITNPQVCIIPVWDFYHPQPSTLSNMLRAGIEEKERDIFSAGLVHSNRLRLAEDGAKIHPSGHVVLRVYKGGKEFQVFVLDDTTTDTPTIIYKSELYKSRN
jgi:beta-lactamase superfamily II metal-dependent hydrolase